MEQQITGLDFKIREMASRIRELREIEALTVAEMAKKYIYDNYRTKFGIKEICQSIGCSKSTLITAFKRDVGMTVNDYITEVRLGEAIRMLLAGGQTIGEIALATGFSDQSYFSKVFSAKHGMSPSEYRTKS